MGFIVIGVLSALVVIGVLLIATLGIPVWLVMEEIMQDRRRDHVRVY